MQPDHFEIVKIALAIVGLILLMTYFCLLFEITHQFSFL